MYRPPVKKMGIDALEELYRNCKRESTSSNIMDSHADFRILDDDSRPFVTKLLAKYRPEILQDAQTQAAPAAS